MQTHSVERTSYGADVGPFFDRARIVANVESAGRKRITLLVAAAGSGKSTALRALLPPSAERGTTFDARSYVGRFDRLPTDLRAAVDAGSQRIVLDSLDVLFSDERTLRDVVGIVDSAPQQIHWVLAARGTFGLPVASWQAYGHSGRPVDSAGLALTLDEIAAAFATAEVELDDASLREIETQTEGWPAGVRFALEAWRTTRDRKEAAQLIGLNAIRFWNEQVLAQLSASEKATLWTASAMPTIDVRLLEAAGCDEAAATLEGLSARTSILQPLEDGQYRCNPLVRAAFAQIAIGGNERRARLRRITTALERYGYVEEALRAASSASAGAEPRVGNASRFRAPRTWLYRDGT